jgi:hypothetical protein
MKGFYRRIKGRKILPIQVDHAGTIFLPEIFLFDFSELIRGLLEKYTGEQYYKREIELVR